MKKLILIILLITFVALVGARFNSVFAVQPEADGAAKLVAHVPSIDPRLGKLSAYLTAHGSPLSGQAAWFIAQADQNNLDWKLVAAIAGVESTFGLEIPTYSYNAWGWGVFTGARDGVHFKDWQDGITQVSQGLRENYLNRGAKTVEQIGRLYAASPTWAWKVHYFLNQIDAYQPTRPALIEITL